MVEWACFDLRMVKAVAFVPQGKAPNGPHTQGIWRTIWEGEGVIDLTMDTRCDDWDNNVRDSLGIQFCMHLFDTCLCLVTLHVNF